ncbi:MAG: flavin oxidoreductase, partial [Cyanobacteriota bacterium]
MAPKDVQVFPLAQDTTALRARTWERLKFEVEYGRQRGTTANAFWIAGDFQALVDLPGESFTEIFLETLKTRFDLTQLNYLILGHINANRGATLKALLELAPQLTVLCSNPAALNLEKICEGQVPPLKIIKNEETLDLGRGHGLELIPVPNPRFPDLLCTYDSLTQILFTDKLFGAHVCGDQVLDEGWTVYQEDRRYYFDCLLVPTPQQVLSALEKLNLKPARLYAPGHGPLIRYGLQAVKLAYAQWLEQQSRRDLRVALIYASAYGNTATLAQAIALGITKAGVAVEALNAETASAEEVKQAIRDCAGFI